MTRCFHLGLIGFVATTITAVTPFIAPPAIAQAPPILEELDLTEEQKDQLRTLFEDRREEIANILTDAQQQQFQAAYREAQDLREAIAAIDNLTEDQKADIQAVVQAFRQDLSTILTDEQLAELRTFVQESRNRRR